MPAKARPAAPAIPAATSQALPEWDLSALYAAPDDPALDADLAWAGERAKAFQEAHKGRLAALDGAALGAAIAEYESIVERLHKALSYAHLLFAGDVGDAGRGRFLQTVRERATTISTDTLFFELELNRVDDGVLERQLEHPAAARYAPGARDGRVVRPHPLSGGPPGCGCSTRRWPGFASRSTGAASACRTP